MALAAVAIMPDAPQVHEKKRPRSGLLMLGSLLVALSVLLSGCEVQCRFYVEPSGGSPAQACSIKTSPRCCQAVHDLELKGDSRPASVKQILGGNATGCTANDLDAFVSGNTCENVKGELPVFVMTGETNMQGFGKIQGQEPGTLESSVNNTRTKQIMGQLVDYSAWENWRTFGDVLMANCGPTGYCRSGHLTTGYGIDRDFVGPELGFGVGMTNAMGSKKILIMKNAFSGGSLAVDFRPPSSTQSADAFCDATCRKCGSSYRCFPDKVGDQYTKLVDSVKRMMHPGQMWQEVPGSHGLVPKLSGLAWLQGWSDVQEACYAAAYKQNLENFVHDVRSAWNTPTLPVVVASSGQYAVGVQQDLGWSYNGVPYTSPSSACASPSANTCNDASACNSCDQACRLHMVLGSQFAASSNMKHMIVMDTRGFWRSAQFAPGSSSDWHWQNSGESFFLIGQALSAGMLQLMKLGGATSESQLQSRWSHFGERSILLQELRGSDLWPPGMRPTVSTSRLYNAAWRSVVHTHRLFGAPMSAFLMVTLMSVGSALLFVRWRRRRAWLSSSSHWVMAGGGCASEVQAAE